MNLNDLGGKNILGKRFSGESLVGKNISFSKAGITRSRTSLIILVLYILNGFTWLISYFGTSAILVSFISNPVRGFTVVVPSVMFFIFLLKYEITFAMLITITLSAAASIVEIYFYGSADVVNGIIAGIFLLLLTGLAVLFTSISIALCLIVSGYLCAIGMFILILIVIISASIPIISFEGESLIDSNEIIKVVVAACVFTFLSIVFSFRISILALKEHPHFSFLKNIAVKISARNGTSFRNCDLTDADFTRADLKNTDLRGANLTRVRFLDAKGLKYACFDKGYFQNPVIRKLITTDNGKNQIYDGLNLEGINLSGFNLSKSSFIEANLTNANLRNADLSGAVLKKTQLDNVDLSGANLTGSTIEDWGITSRTKLNKVECKYVFMRLETEDDPNRIRKPDDWESFFENGEFSDFIQPYFDTLDLYHRQDIDPRAISITLKRLLDNHPNEKLEFVAMEKRGRNGLNLKLSTLPNANKSDLSHEYFSDYHHVKNSLPLGVQLKLTEKDSEIRALKGTIEKFIQVGSHKSILRAETIQVVQGELNMTENKGVNINAGGSIGDVSGLFGGDISGVVNLGEISGNVTNAINELPNENSADQINLRSLLSELQKVIQEDNHLSSVDKADLLEQVQSFAGAKKLEEPLEKEGLVRKATKIFDATLKGLPETAKIVEACSKLLPLILRALGLPA